MVDVIKILRIEKNNVIQAVKDGTVRKDEYIMLNCTGGGTLSAMSKGFVHKEPDLVLSPDLPAEEVIRSVLALF